MLATWPLKLPWTSTEGFHRLQHPEISSISSLLLSASTWSIHCHVPETTLVETDSEHLALIVEKPTGWRSVSVFGEVRGLVSGYNSDRFLQKIFHKLLEKFVKSFLLWKSSAIWYIRGGTSVQMIGWLSVLVQYGKAFTHCRYTHNYASTTKYSAYW